MKSSINTKRGSVIALCLVFSTVLLIMGLGYSRLTTNSKKQTVMIDDRIKLEYLASGMTELAALKYQLFPADFYACIQAYKLGYKTALENFTIKSPEFNITGDTKSFSTYNKNALSLRLASMTILTDNKWEKEVLYIHAKALITRADGTQDSKDVVRVVELERNVIGID